MHILNRLGGICDRILLFVPFHAAVTHTSGAARHLLGKTFSLRQPQLQSSITKQGCSYVGANHHPLHRGGMPRRKQPSLALTAAPTTRRAPDGLCALSLHLWCGTQVPCPPSYGLGASPGSSHF